MKAATEKTTQLFIYMCFFCVFLSLEKQQQIFRWLHSIDCILGALLYWFIMLSVSCILYPSDCPLCRWEPCRAAGEPWDSLGSTCTWVVDDMGHGLGGSQEDTGLHKVYIKMIQDYTRYTSAWYRTTQSVHQDDTELHKVYIMMIQDYTRYISGWYRTTQGIHKDDRELNKVHIRMIQDYIRYTSGWYRTTVTPHNHAKLP